MICYDVPINKVYIDLKYMHVITAPCKLLAALLVSNFISLYKPHYNLTPNHHPHTLSSTPKMGDPLAYDHCKNQRWEALWAMGLQPGDYFDKKQPLPYLVEQVKSGNIPAGNRALIPGCGRAYDVELLSRSGLFARVIGADISPTAVHSAQQYLSAVTPKLPNNYQLVAADFFTSDLGLFDLVYEYTFFCAFPPAMRKKWGERMTQLVRPGGCLITVMYPMVEDVDLTEGPPYLVSVGEYEKVLGEFVKIDGPVRLLDEEVHCTRGGGMTWWCRWERVDDRGARSGE